MPLSDKTHYGDTDKASKALKKKAPMGLKNVTYDLRQKLASSSRDPVDFLAKVVAGHLFTVDTVEDGNVISHKRRPTLDQRITAAKSLVNKVAPDLKSTDVEVLNQTNVDIRQLSRVELLAIASDALDGQLTPEARQALKEEYDRNFKENTKKMNLELGEKFSAPLNGTDLLENRDNDLLLEEVRKRHEQRDKINGESKSASARLDADYTVENSK